eukprot:44668_1
MSLLALVVWISFTNSVHPGTTFHQNVSCDQTVSGNFSFNETHYYHLYLNNTYNLDFESCNSKTDLILIVLDEIGSDISNKYCDSGDYCGSCSNTTSYPEQFMIPSMNGHYILTVQPYNWNTYAATEYVVTVGCEPANPAVSCDQRLLMSNFTSFNQKHFYPFSTTTAKSIMFTSSPNRTQSILITIHTSTDNKEVARYCCLSDGECTSCWASYRRQFVPSGTYFIAIQPSYDYTNGYYELYINCTDTPPSGAPTTSPSVYDGDCIYYYDKYYSLLSSYNSTNFDVIAITDDTIEIEFDIFFAHGGSLCYLSDSCTILELFTRLDEYELTYQLIIDDAEDSITLNIMKYERYAIHNMSNIFTHNQWHRIYFYFDDYQILFKVDGQLHSDITLDRELIFETFGSFYTFTKPWSVGLDVVYYDLQLRGRLNATLTNLCINTQVAAALECDYYDNTFTGVVDVMKPFFHLNNNEYEQSVMIQYNGSLNRQLQLILYDLNLTILANKIITVFDTTGDIYIHALPAGQYVLKLDYNKSNPYMYDPYQQQSVYEQVHLELWCGVDFMFLQQEVGCGDFMNGTMDRYDALHVYYFDVEYHTTVLFDTCQSDIDSFVLKPMAMDFNMKHGTSYHPYQDDQYDFGFMDDMYDIVEVCEDTTGYRFAYSLDPGRYAIELSHYGNPYYIDTAEYDIPIVCNYTVKQERYHLMYSRNEETVNLYSFQYEINVTSHASFEDAVFLCEYLFGTGLATISSNTDKHLMDWIAMQNADFLDGERQAWIARFVDGKESNNSIPFGRLGTIYVLDSDSATSGGELEYEIDFNTKKWFICDGWVTWRGCIDKEKCWLAINCCNDSNLSISNYTLRHKIGFNQVKSGFDFDQYSYQFDPVNQNTFAPPFAVWDSKMFVFGVDAMYITAFHLFDTFYKWRNVSYEQWEATTIFTGIQTYAQHEEYVYFYDAELRQIVSIDMNTERVYFSSASTVSIGPAPCIVSGDNYIYIMDAYAFTIKIYDIKNDTWRSSADYYAYVTEEQLVTFPISCAITNDYKFVYFFAFARLSNKNIKYDAAKDEFSGLLLINPCNVGLGRTVTAKNNKIYFSGCYVNPFKSLTFDPDIDEFESITHGVYDPYIDPLVFRKSQTTVFDDNILLLAHPSPSMTSLSIYYMLTDLISINLEGTASQDIWPSDGFDIHYYVNDFTDSASMSNVYYIWMDSDAIQQVIELNTTTDGCMCNGYKCYQCVQHFDLAHHLTVDDDGIERILFTMSYASNNTGSALILEPYASIALQRCSISFDNVTRISAQQDPKVGFVYHLSDNCYYRIDATFSVMIASSVRDINRQLTIAIDGAHSVTCTHCAMDGSNKCISCTADYIEIEHKVLNTDQEFKIVMTSQSIDLTIISSDAFSVSFDRADVFTLSEAQIGGIVAGACALFAAIASIIFYFYRKAKLLKEAQQRFVYYIRNPMVVFIGVATYKTDVEKKGIDVYCPDLFGINVDYLNIKTMCRIFKYDLYPKYEKYNWTQHEMIEFIEECVATVSQSLNTNVEDDNMKSQNKSVNGYDGVLFIISGHGYNNNIITSDYQTVNKTAMHRLFSTNYPQLRDVPRVFLFDCCDGDQQRSPYPADYVDEDKGKHFNVDDIKVDQFEGEMWKADQKNPDFKLSTIHAANEGFQSKLNSLDGSYLIYEFIKRMIRNVEDKEEQFIGEIIQSIQTDLHDRGKQQIQFTFNNHTRYLKFIPFDIETPKEIIVNEETDDMASSDKGKTYTVACDGHEMQLAKVKSDTDS